ncbi:uncharacterized protein CEXT_799171 [Caerostris extrusa]|uniref:Uncharacterized protein n=1 Tax=Caerostris extrusa TaxID=172846 RepID=A0AAV4W2K6_CAEEX|nr:uncharacterized protein CEXT_799171 [Caerostris extrusa]
MCESNHQEIPSLKMFVLAVLACIALVQSDGGHQPQPYKFGYSIKDKHGEQHRDESGNGAGAVVGSYGYTDNKGIARQVHYVADKAGFRAQVKTNEPGTATRILLLSKSSPMTLTPVGQLNPMVMKDIVTK